MSSLADIREPLAIPDPNHLTFTGFIRRFCEEHELTDAHEAWAKKNFILHAPAYILSLWEAFPEWPPVQKLLDDNPLSISLMDPPCLNCERGRSDICTGRAGEPRVFILIGNRVVAEY